MRAVATDRDGYNIEKDDMMQEVSAGVRFVLPSFDSKSDFCFRRMVETVVKDESSTSTDQCSPFSTTERSQRTAESSSSSLEISSRPPRKEIPVNRNKVRRSIRISLESLRVKSMEVLGDRGGMEELRGEFRLREGRIRGMLGLSRILLGLRRGWSCIRIPRSSPSLWTFSKNNCQFLSLSSPPSTRELIRRSIDRMGRSLYCKNVEVDQEDSTALDLNRE